MKHELKDPMLDIVDAIEEAVKYLKARVPDAPPKVEVEVAAPKVDVAAPKVEVQVDVPPAPRKWIGEILERDSYGLVKKFSLKAQD